VVGLNLSEKKQKERKVAVVVTDSHDSRSLKKQPLIKHKKGVLRRHTFYSKPTPLTSYCSIVFTVGICLRTDRYLKEYSIEREIWSIEEERTNARARKE
jgi:hypothetical protein